MARKKAVKKSIASKSSRAKTAARKKTVRKQTATKGRGAKQAAPAARPRKKVARKRVSLGRARIPADARLDLVFQKDYQAREVFEFLRVETVRDLEQFGPAEILEKLTGPMVQTIQRIRKALALYNRCLANDQEFAAGFKAEFARK
jgi:hypothetical protein